MNYVGRDPIYKIKFLEKPVVGVAIIEMSRNIFDI